ncbi:MAG: Fis family transcriptional regulator, partial [Candidatus Krumholzibacteria bacterium]|nr:Fis family transcriptional regulator [Candidatus Krumholzibacteria bacterium]
QDLYYRINVVRLRVPPLREHKEDVPLLVDHFIDHFNRLKGKSIVGVSPDVIAALMQHDFPGNVRELENVIEHAFVLCRSGSIQMRHLPEHLRVGIEPTEFSESSNLDELEARFIRETLRRNGWNRTAAARELGIHKTTLWRKIKRLGIELPRIDGRSSPL